MRLVGLSPGFSRGQWEGIMSIARSVQVRELAYQEWLAEQDEKYEMGNWRWYLSYLHGPGIMPISSSGGNNLSQLPPQ